MNLALRRLTAFTQRVRPFLGPKHSHWCPLVWIRGSIAVSRLKDRSLRAVFEELDSRLNTFGREVWLDKVKCVSLTPHVLHARLNTLGREVRLDKVKCVSLTLHVGNRRTAEPMMGQGPSYGQSDLRTGEP
jgi:hypothetical protein